MAFYEFKTLFTPSLSILPHFPPTQKLTYYSWQSLVRSNYNTQHDGEHYQLRTINAGKSQYKEIVC